MKHIDKIILGWIAFIIIMSIIPTVVLGNSPEIPLTHSERQINCVEYIKGHTKDSLLDFVLNSVNSADHKTLIERNDYEGNTSLIVHDSLTNVFVKSFWSKELLCIQRFEENEAVNG